MFVDQSFFKNVESMELLFQSESVEEFLCGFVNFVESHFNKVLEIMDKYKNLSIDMRIRNMEMAFEILKRFSESVGIDLIQEAQLPQEIDFSAFFDNIFEEEDLISVFIHIVRKEIRHF